jgi:hypothetical protein
MTIGTDYEMKLLLLFALVKPTQPLKPWTHDMCQVRQKYATDEYIAYCKYESPDKHPRCREDDKTGKADEERHREAIKQGGAKGAVFEYYDCSWHPGKK